MHAVVEDGIGHRPKVELELSETQGEISFTIALVEHHLLRVNRPSLYEDT